MVVVVVKNGSVEVAMVGILMNGAGVINRGLIEVVKRRGADVVA